MLNEMPNCGAPDGYTPTKRAGQTNEEKQRAFVEYVKAVDALLSPGVLDLIVQRVLRALYRNNAALKKPVKKEPRTVVQKIFNFQPGAFAQSVQIHGALCRENDRTEKLIAELRQARAEYLAAVGASLPKP